MEGGREDAACKASIPNSLEWQKDHVYIQFIMLKLLPQKQLFFNLKEEDSYQQSCDFSVVPSVGKQPQNHS